MSLYIGTLSNKRIIQALREDENDVIPTYPSVVIKNMSDDEIVEQILNKGLIKNAFNHFFAKDLADAKMKAKELSLKNFGMVGKIYESGIDY